MQLDPRAAEGGTATSNYKWWVVFMLWFICFFNYADRQAISVVLPKLQEEFGFDKQQQGLIASAFMWVYAAGAPLAGYIGDRVRRKDLILGGCLFWSFITILTGWCGKLWHFVTVRALEGFGETFYFPASMSLVSDYHSSKTRSRAMSFHQSSVYVGTIAGSWFAAWLAQHYDWRYGFYFFGFGGMVLAALLYKFLREPRRGQADPGTLEGHTAPATTPTEALRYVFGSSSARMLMLAFMGANSVAMIFLMWTPTFLVDKFDFKLTAAGLSGSVYIQIASACTVPLGGLAADWLSRRYPGGRMLVQAIGLIVGAGFVFLVGSAASVGMLIFAMTVFGACKGIYDSNIFASMYDVVPPQARATAAGIMNTVGWAAGALATYAFGYFAKNGPYGSDVANMSHIISFGGAIYLGAAGCLLAGFMFAKRDVITTSAPTA